MLQSRRNGRAVAGTRFVGKGPKGPRPVCTCDYCGDECGRETYAELVDGEVTGLYCSKSCMRKGMCIDDDLRAEIAREVRKECNWLHTHMCGRCTNLIRELHRKLQFD